MKLNRFNRSNFLEDFNNNGVVEKNFDDNYFKNFQLNNPYKVYDIKHDSIGRPDLISFLFYGTSDYWWIISKVNNIDDWWNDLEVGDKIKIPDMKDIQDFYMRFKNSKKKI